MSLLAISEFLKICRDIGIKNCEGFPCPLCGEDMTYYKDRLAYWCHEHGFFKKGDV